MRVRWIIPLYDFPPGISQFCLPDKFRRKLTELAGLADSDDLLAAYVTKSLGYIDEPDLRIDNYLSAYRGRIAGLMRVLPLPAGGRVEDYYEHDWDDATRVRWSIGLPAQAVRRAAPDACPEISVVFEQNKLAMPNLNEGPVELAGVMAPISSYLLQRLPDVLLPTQFPRPGPRPVAKPARRWR
jgi:hypothetical protein